MLKSSVVSRLSRKHRSLVGNILNRYYTSGSAAQSWQTVDGCTAVTHVSYGMTDTSFIFPITPSSPIAELAEQWSQLGVKNAFGDVVKVTQMQSEAGAAGALHGALTAGSLATTYTASQGLLLMIPNMYKISGELLPCVIHVAARAIAGQGLSIFGDHQDVMATRQTGFALLCANTVQETADMGLIAHLATLRARVPFVHFFDGFRVSHTIEKVELLQYNHMKKLVDFDALYEHHNRALNPMHPHLRGTNQNPDVYFQLLEASNKYYEDTPGIVQEEMDKVSAVTGRPYKLFDWSGPADAEYALIVLGSGGPIVEEALPSLIARGDKVGVLKPRLYRPWSAKHFLQALPPSVKKIAVLDRTKEPGSHGEPLYLDVAASVQNDPSRSNVKVIGGRWGLGQKEFTPGHVVSVVDNLKKEAPLERFSVGIEDDVTHLSLPKAEEPEVMHPGTTECLIFGFGSDGTVGANKNAMKILGDNTDLFVQGYFAYGSQKAGGLTVSHLRFGPKPMTSYYAVSKADYVGCHNNVYVDMYRMLDSIKVGGTFCLNSPWTSLEALETHLPPSLRKAMSDKKVQFYNVDAFHIAEKAGMGRMINVVMQAAFFKLSGVMDYEKSMALFKTAIKKSYGHRGDAVVQKNYQMVDQTLDAIKKIDYPDSWGKLEDLPLEAERKYMDQPDEFVRNIQGKISMMKGDSIKVSEFAGETGGTMPMGTAALEKRGIALEVPEVDMDKCTHCNYCSLSCPHAVIRPFLLSQEEVDRAPSTFDSRKAKGGADVAGLHFRIQVSPFDCTGCAVCVNTCPDDALRMVSFADIQETSSENWDFAMALPDRSERFEKASLRGSQFQQPLLEFHGACAGCGETPYVKLLTQLFGQRMVIANATGCSSIWGAPYGSNPYTVRKLDNTGPAWGNSLFEDAAEYGLGMAVTTASRRKALRARVQDLLLEGRDSPISPELYAQLQEWIDNFNNWKVCDRLARSLPAILDAEADKDPLVKEVSKMSDLLPKLSMWTIGGDGWAYDIGFGGLDHVLASGQNVNVLVLDTEVYSNTGGQKSKSTPLGAIAKFATGGREMHKKSMAEMAMSYGNVYVANCSMGANMQQTLKAFVEAEAYDGAAMVIAYSPCIEHKNLDGMSHTMNHMALVANSGYFPLFRFNPLLKKDGKNPFLLDTKKLTVDVMKVIEGEMRYGALKKKDAEKFEQAVAQLRIWIKERFEHLQAMASTMPGQTFIDEGRPLTILYGSETGTTQELAYRTADLAKQRGFAVKVVECDEVDVAELADHKNLVVMCSTCGEGDIPQNARGFVEQLQKAAESGEGKTMLQGVQFGVFALGDSSYHQFCSAGKDIDAFLEKLGAERMVGIGIGNDQDEDKFETGYEGWLPEYWKVQNAPEPEDDGSIPEAIFELALLDDDAVAVPYKQIVAPNTIQARVDQNKRLTRSDYDRDIRHIQIDLLGQDLPYLLGDVLNVFPKNNVDRVDQFLRSYGLDGGQMVKMVPMTEQMDARKKNAALRPRSVQQVFVEMLDIFGRPNRNFYKALSKFAVDGKEKAELLLLANSENEEGRKLYSQYSNETATFADILNKYSSAKVPLEHLMTILPCIKPRLYSIASSPRFVGPNLVELAIVILQWNTPGGVLRTGTGTDYIQNLKEGDVIAATITSGSFNFPADPMTPMIMAGLGTGLAPFRAFVQERKWIQSQGTKTGPMWLFYGCRYKTKDYIFGDELEKFAEEGVLTELHPAFSRDQKKKVYVQDKIEAVQDQVYEDLITKNGYFYLCGQAGQVELDIKNAVYNAIAKGEGCSKEAAKQKFEELTEEGRYCPELY